MLGASDIGDHLETLAGLGNALQSRGDLSGAIAEFRSARETMRLVEAGADGISPGDIAAAITGYRAVYEYVIADHRAP